MPQSPPQRSRHATTLPWATILPAFAVALAAIYSFSAGKSVFFCFDPLAVGDAVLAGKLPYRDFALEYPPLMALLFAVPAALTDSPDTFHRLFRSLMFVGWVALAVSFLRAGVRARTFLLLSALAAWLWIVSPDIGVALLAWLAFRALLREKPARSAGWSAAGAALKVVPLGLLPLAARVGRAPARALVAAVAILAALVALVLPAALASPDARDYGLEQPSCAATRGDPERIEQARAESDPASYHSARALHRESTLGSLVVLGRVLQGRDEGSILDHKAEGVAGTGRAETVAAVLLFALVAVPLVVRGDPRSPATWGALLLAIPALGPVASPQFLVWALPFVALSSRTARASYAVALALSFAYFMLPLDWVRLNGSIVPSLTLLARNAAAIVAVLAMARTSLASARADASSPILTGMPAEPRTR